MKNFLKTLILIWDYWFVNTDRQGRNLAEHLTAKRKQFVSFKMRGRVLQDNARDEKTQQNKCNHRQGYRVGFESGKVTREGESEFYSVIHHTFPWNDVWVICLRCSKRWKPGMPDYEEALKFKTTNSPSKSITFQGPNVVKEARELTKES